VRRPSGSPARPGLSRSRRRNAGVARFAAPAAFLLALTVAVLLIRSGINGGGTTTTTERGPVTHASTAATPPPGTTRKATTTLAGSFYTVESGDTFGSISAKTGVPIAELEQLNPSVSSNSLQVGQKLRVK
jgi:LysM repeat protein